MSRSSSSPLKQRQAIIAAADVFIRRRRRPKMIYAAVAAVVLLIVCSLMSSSWQPSTSSSSSSSPSSRSSCKWQVNAETTTSHDTSAAAATTGKAKQTATAATAHPPVYADTKYWIRSTEFGERDNWLNQHRPCTLFERIKMNEQSVVSMGSSMDSLGGNQMDANNIYELTLAQNGMLLLEEDPPDDPIQAAFIDFLKAIGDCSDEHSLNEQQQQTEDTDHLPSGKKHLFEFEPDSDEMSWFNPQNWASTPNEYGIEDWIPESHQIPCSEDIVVFGGRHDLLEPILETGERAKTISFKVNFRPSRASLQAEQAVDTKSKNLKNSIESLRVSKLLIGERQYDQQDFEKLIDSDDYGDILFQFNDSMSALKQDSGGYSIGGSPLIIDESSLVRDSSQNICLDEAGCLCGNERAEIMNVICSFNERLTDDDLPCTDPIYSAGHCNKICATSLTISMDPSKFSERFLSSIIEKHMKEQDRQDNSVLVGARRIDVDKYEILFRHMPNEDEAWSAAGAELEAARGILQQLEIRAIKSFYGIKTIKTKSSVQWRRNDRETIFWFTATLLSLVSVVIIVRKTSVNDLDSTILSELGDQSWLTNIWDRVRQGEDPGDAQLSSENQPTSTGRDSSDMHGSFSNIPLVMLDENDIKED